MTENETNDKNGRLQKKLSIFEKEPFPI